MEHPLLAAVREKSAKIDVRIFRAFAERVNKAIEDDEDQYDLAPTLSALKTPATDRVPRQGYSRPEMSRTLVDYVNTGK